MGSETSNQERIETEAEVENPRDMARRWKTEIEMFENKRAEYLESCRKIIRRYKDERQGVTDKQRKKMNLLWSNVETLKPTVYAQAPKIQVKRNNDGDDPVGRVAALVLERACEHFNSRDDKYTRTMRQCRDDWLLCGLGVSWVRFEADFDESDIDQVQEGDESAEVAGLDEDAGEPVPVVRDEAVIDDFVHYTDFGHNAGARTWDEVYAVWRRAYMTRDELRERFGDDIGNAVPLDTAPEGISESNDQYEAFKKAAIYEIWDKSSKRVIWISKGHDRPLDVQDDPLGLDGFFPCPRPLFGTIANDSLIPRPDYALYQDQAEEIDQLTGRIDAIVAAMRTKGLYAADVPEIRALFQDGQEGELIPVQNWQMLAERGGLKNSILYVELEPLAKTLQVLYAAREKAKADLYEVTGISDIVRGASDSRETATAQQIKSQWGALRIRERQKEMARFARDQIRLKAEVIAEHFSPETIMQIANVAELSERDQQLVPAAIELLKSEKMRGFRITIETDSTIAADEEAEKRSRIEFITAVTNFAQAWGPIIERNPAMVKLASEMLKFGVRGFKAGETLESVIESTTEQIEQMAAQPRQPQPDPKMIEVQAKQQLEQARLQADVQAKQQELALRTEEMAAKLAIEREKLAAETQKRRDEMAASGKMNADDVAAAIQGLQAMAETMRQNGETIMAALNQHSRNLAAVVSAPKRVIRDEAGRPVGVEPILPEGQVPDDPIAAAAATPKRIVRDENGNIIGAEPAPTMQ